MEASLLEAKCNFEDMLITELSQSNNSVIYKYINSLKARKSIPTTLTLDSQSSNTDFGKATLFNVYFHSVFTISDFTLPTMETVNDPSLNNISISEDDVFSALSSLDASKATGPDGIGPRLLRSCALALYIPLHHLYSLSLHQHYIPRDWRIHNITPIFKSGDKTSVKNYRPISLLNNCSLVLERIIYDKVSSFLVESIVTSQFGFLKKHSTLQQLLILLHDVFNSFDKNAQTDVIYLDFRKAFDTVPHKELLQKLWSIGVAGELWQWFEAYLSSRYQRVCLNHCYSGFLHVISGVPQGSILGPLLFLVYINDIQTSLTSKLLLFADDTKCYRKIKSPSDTVLLQQDLDLLVDWCDRWNMRFNSSKCVHVTFSKNRPSFVSNYTLMESEISISDQAKDLGVLFSSNLSWCNHYSKVISGAYKILGLLRRTFSKSISVKAKKTLYLTLVRSHFIYCSVLWRPYLIKDIKALEAVQRRSTKFILQDYDMDYKNRLKKLNMLPLMMYFELADIMFFVKSIKAPTNRFDINKFISFSSTSTRYATNLKLNHCFSSSNHARHFYFNRLPRLWNALPVFDLTQSDITIKRKLYEFLFNHFTTNFDPINTCTFHFLCPCSKCSCHPPAPHFST